MAFHMQWNHLHAEAVSSYISGNDAKLPKLPVLTLHVACDLNSLRTFRDWIPAKARLSSFWSGLASRWREPSFLFSIITRPNIIEFRCRPENYSKTLNKWGLYNLSLVTQYICICISCLVLLCFNIDNNLYAVLTLTWPSVCTCSTQQGWKGLEFEGTIVPLQVLYAGHTGLWIEIEIWPRCRTRNTFE